MFAIIFWRRRSGRMTDKIDKLRILLKLLHFAREDWRKGVWSKNLDDAYCCDGRECCCGGITVYEAYMGKPRR